jgi:hypothetical protein
MVLVAITMTAAITILMVRMPIIVILMFLPAAVVWEVSWTSQGQR